VLTKNPLKKVIGYSALLLLLMTRVVYAQQPVASFSVSQTEGCAPLIVNFINNSQNATSYHWDFGNGMSSALPSPVITFNNAGNYTISLVAINASGADSVILTHLIKISNKPVVQFSASKTSACMNELISFNNQSSGYDSCEWDFGDGVTSKINNPAHSYSLAGSFPVTLILYKGGSACTASLTKNNYITIHALPSITATVDTFATCDVNKNFQFTGTSAPAGTLVWDFGDGATAIGSAVQHHYTSPGSYTVSVTSTSVNGCTSTLQVNKQITVLSNPVPVITASILSGCTPFSTVLNASAPGAVSLQWDLKNGITSTLGSVATLYNFAGTYQPSLTANYANGCSNSATPVSILVLASPVANFTSNITNGCKPLSVTFSPQVANGASYQWQSDDGGSGTGSTFTYTYQHAGNYHPLLTITATNGCSTEYTFAYGINVNGPDIDFVADKTTGCNPLTVNFTNLSLNASSWLWKFGNGDTSSAFSPTYTYQQQGSYSVTLYGMDASGCKDSLIKTNYIHPGGTVNNFSSSQPITGCAPLTISLSDSSSATSWLWDFGDGNTSTQQSPTHTYNAPGTYAVSLQTQSSGGNCSQLITNFATYNVGGGTAEFTYTQTLCPPFIGYFTDSSTNAISWLWNFGDGQTSTVQNPTHTYSQTGNYNVSLSITTADGCHTNTVHQYAMSFISLGASPSAITTDTVLPMNVQFYANTVGATSWLWTFGDGDSSTLENPLHPYTTTGPFTITLTIANDSCTTSYSFPPTDFGSGGTLFDATTDSTTYTMNYDGCAPLTINFHNPLINITSSFWDFGDGNTSTQLNPSHTYTMPGIYDVMLISVDNYGIPDTIYTSHAVKVAGTSAAFSLQNVSTCSGVNIAAIPQNQSAATYHWDFGDQTTSNLMSPTHTFTNTNNYIISLQLTDSLGCTSVYSTSFYSYTSTNPVMVNKSRACADEVLTFSLPNSNYVSYLWNFGDNTSATGNTVAHSYSKAGFYPISVDVTDVSGCHQTFNSAAPVEINKPVADFSMGAPTSNCNWVHYDFSNSSTGSTYYLWDLGNGITSTQVNCSNYYYYNQNAPVNYAVTLTAYKNGCSSSKTINNAVHIPNFYADFTYTRTNGCLPVTITVADSSNEVYKWKWYWGDGDSSTVKNATHTFHTVPTGKITLVAEDVNGCIKQIEKDKILFPDAIGNVSDTSGCNPLAVTFTNQSMNAVQWLWNFGDGTTANTITATHTYSQTGNFTPMLIATDSFGCADTAMLTQVKITEPTCNFGYSITSGCAPVTAQFNNLSQNAATYLWNFGDGSTSSQQHPTHIYTSGGSYNVSLTITDSAGCTATHTLNNSIVIPGPRAKFSVDISHGCAPLTVTFTDSSQQAASYFWSFSDGDSSTLQSPVHTFTTSGTYQASLIITDNNGCQSVYTQLDTLKVDAAPLLQFTVSDTAICSSQTINFINTTTGANQYYWNFGDGTSSFKRSPTHHYQNAGIYTITLTASNGACTDSLTYNHLIRVVAQPTADFSINSPTGCAPLSVTFTNSCSNTQNATYQWYSDNGFQSSVFSPSFQYDNPGHYSPKLVVTNEHLCSDSIVKTHAITAFNSDPLPPAEISYITVLDSSSIRITWNNSTALNLKQYELYRADDQIHYHLISTLNNSNNTSMGPTSVFIDTSVQPNNQSYSYKIVTVNSCDTAYPLDSSEAHTSVYLKTLAGTGKVNLNWNAYTGRPVDVYYVYRSEDALNYDLIGETNALTYIDTAAYCAIPFYYKVEAEFQGTSFSSESNNNSATPQPPNISLLPKIKRSTVVRNEYVLTEWDAPDTMSFLVAYYLIYRSDDSQPGEYIFLDKVDNNTFSYVDRNTDVINHSYSYKIEVENICNLTTGLTSESATILLKSSLNDMNGSRLEWTPYKGWEQGVEKYEIQQQDADGNWKTIKTVDGKTNHYEED
jgi:PKD repeat protein